MAALIKSEEQAGEDTSHKQDLATSPVIASDQQNQVFTLGENSCVDGSSTSSFVTCSNVSQSVSQNIVLISNLSSSCSDVSYHTYFKIL